MVRSNIFDFLRAGLLSLLVLLFVAWSACQREAGQTPAQEKKFLFDSIPSATTVNSSIAEASGIADRKVNAGH
jgi:hypothetical protein